MKTFPLIVSSPDGAIWEGDAVMLTVRGVEGDLAIMAGHIPLITPVVACQVKIELEEEDDIIAKTDGGLLSVASDRVTLLTGSFAPIE